MVARGARANFSAISSSLTQTHYPLSARGNSIAGKSQSLDQSVLTGTHLGTLVKFSHQIHYLSTPFEHLQNSNGSSFHFLSIQLFLEAMTGFFDCFFPSGRSVGLTELSSPVCPIFRLWRKVFGIMMKATSLHLSEFSLEHGKISWEDIMKACNRN
jgi:hypothetical protein